MAKIRSNRLNVNSNNTLKNRIRNLFKRKSRATLISTTIAIIMFGLLGLSIYQSIIIFKVRKTEIIEAKVVNKWERTSTRGSVFSYLEYEYIYNKKHYSNKAEVNGFAYGTLNKNDILKVEVIEAKPWISRVTDKYKTPSLMYPMWYLSGYIIIIGIAALVLIKITKKEA